MMARRIQTEVPNMTPEIKQIVTDLWCEWEHADFETYDARKQILQTKWKARKNG
jgi:Trm5-related predicted tRNA methylase